VLFIIFDKVQGYNLGKQEADEVILSQIEKRLPVRVNIAIPNKRH
jgi:hypothetical protein